MTLKVVGAGVGRTGTLSLKVALERLLSGRCHHMFEVVRDPAQVAGWSDAIYGRPVDWSVLMSSFSAVVDWPGASFWPELLAANPDALVILSVRGADEWYRSASNTIFIGLDQMSREPGSWIAAVRTLLRDRFCDKFDDPAAMMAAFERHNDDVRARVPRDQLLEWQASDGWDPICARLGLAVPDQAFPVTNTTAEFQARFRAPREQPP
jgi:hypothetical protein